MLSLCEIELEYGSVCSAKRRFFRGAKDDNAFAPRKWHLLGLAIGWTGSFPRAKDDGVHLLAGKSDSERASTMFGECFDPKADLFTYERLRPHWSQAGAVVFVTFRTHDSIPREVIQRWEREKQQWVCDRGADMAGHWSVVLPTLCEQDQMDFQKTFNRCREAFLDTCQGRCLLKHPRLAKIVADALLHFDGVRYRMGDFVVMPNHVHLLAVFPTADALKKQCDSWLHYTAFRINQVIGEKGKFWQQEPFDHLVRSLEQYDYLRRYIADNPRKAGLTPGEFLCRRLPG